MHDEIPFDQAFCALMGHAPFPWQRELYRRISAGDWKRLTACDIPTGLGKTAVIPIWLIALANWGDVVPRRLVYVVNRRTVVDQATDEARKIRDALMKHEAAGIRARLESLRALDADEGSPPLAISTLRGQFADNREWSADPARPAIIVGTVDMIGSRLLFGGYGVGFKTKPLHAGFLGHDALLVHDEAHLEPAFQKLIEAIRDEQEKEPAPLGEAKRLRVMALTATSRVGDALGLTEADRADTEVRKRIEARKSIHLHEYGDEKKLPELLADLALSHKGAKRAVLVFARTVEAVEKVVEKLRKELKEEEERVVPLTGTLRGKERDALVEHKVFQRFLPGAKPGNDDDTVYLVCTSAGEVGVNISADHLACDLSTYESMAQRFGRVNRFGERDDTRIDILHPKELDEGKEVDIRRARTLLLLRALNGDGSPASLGRLDPDDRRAAFSPDPVFLPTSDILFDAWALTSIRGKLPGRPTVEPYLHGLTDGDPPMTQVAWREEVDVIGPELQDLYKPEDLLEVYPLKPHELLRDRSDRVFKQLATIAERSRDAWGWLLQGDGSVEPIRLGELADKDKKGRIDGRTVLLPPSVGGLEGGLLKGGSAAADDVADEWLDEQGNSRRVRRWDDDPAPDRMRLILTIDTAPDTEDKEDADETPSRRFWRWYVKPRSSDDDMSRAARDAVLLKVHTADVTKNSGKVVAKLLSLWEPRDVLILAAGLHDLGKDRALWQRSIGNRDPEVVLAKSGTAGKDRRPRLVDFDVDYRHEFGSLLDAESNPAFQALDDDHRDLVLHLVAAHHGRGRPHFGPDEIIDPVHPRHEADRVAAEVPGRFARLQRRFGRWGLAYLESLLRAADYAASARPGKPMEVEP